MKRLVILCVVLAGILVLWRPWEGRRLISGPDAPGRDAAQVEPASRASKIASPDVAERKPVLPGDASRGSRATGSSFTGRLYVQTHGRREALTKDADVLLAPAETVAVAEIGGLMTFRRFSMSGTGDPVPEALDGEALHAHDGSWSMPVPERAYVVTAVTVDGDPWVVVGERSISAGTTSADFFVAPPQMCELHVVDRHGAPVSDVVVRATPRVPRGVPISFTDGPAEATAVKAAKPKTGERHAPAPPAHASELRTQESPIRFARREFDRDIWIGKAGFAWERCAWPASRMTGKVTLLQATELTIQVSGLKPSPEGYNLVISHDGGVVGIWRNIQGDGDLSVSGAPIGTLRAVLRKSTPAGQLVIHRSLVEVPPTAAFTLDISVDPARASGPGALEVLVLDPHAALGDLDTLFVCRSQDAIGGSSKAGRHLWNKLPGADEGHDSRVLHLTDLPYGTYVVALPRVGEVVAARLDEESPVASVSIDLSELIEVAVDGRPGVTGETHSLKWHRTSDGGEQSLAHMMAGVGFPARAAWRDGAWRLRVSPGDVTYEVTSKADGSRTEYGVLSVQPGLGRLALGGSGIGGAILGVRVDRARIEDQAELVADVLSSLQGPEGIRPLLLGARFSDVVGEHGQLDIHVGIPANTRWEFEEQESALAFSEVDLPGIAPGAERLVEAVVKQPR